MRRTKATLHPAHVLGVRNKNNTFWVKQVKGQNCCRGLWSIGQQFRNEQAATQTVWQWQKIYAPPCENNGKSTENRFVVWLPLIRSHDEARRLRGTRRAGRRALGALSPYRSRLTTPAPGLGQGVMLPLALAAQSSQTPGGIPPSYTPAAAPSCCSRLGGRTSSSSKGSPSWGPLLRMAAGAFGQRGLALEFCCSCGAWFFSWGLHSQPCNPLTAASLADASSCWLPHTCVHLPHSPKLWKQQLVLFCLARCSCRDWGRGGGGARSLRLCGVTPVQVLTPIDSFTNRFKHTKDIGRLYFPERKEEGRVWQPGSQSSTTLFCAFVEEEIAGSTLVVRTSKTAETLPLSLPTQAPAPRPGSTFVETSSARGGTALREVHARAREVKRRSPDKLPGHCAIFIAPYHNVIDWLLLLQWLCLYIIDAAKNASQHATPFRRQIQCGSNSLQCAAVAWSSLLLLSQGDITHGGLVHQCHKEFPEGIWLERGLKAWVV